MHGCEWLGQDGQAYPGPWTGAQDLLIISPDRIKGNGGQAGRHLLLTMLPVWDGVGTGGAGHTLSVWILILHGSGGPRNVALMWQLCPGRALSAEPWGRSVVCPFMQKAPARPGPVHRALGRGWTPTRPPPDSPGAPRKSTQRWEQCTALLIFSTKAIRYVWYSISIWEFSLLLTGPSRGEGGPAGRHGMGALCQAPAASIHAQSPGGATQELGPRQSRLHLNWLPPPSQPIHRGSGSGLAPWSLVVLLGGSSGTWGTRLISSEASMGDRAMGCQSGL